MFKQLTAAILLLAFITGTFSKSLIIADYYLNTSAYAKDCINKAKPNMHCNGKCQMMKKLKAEEEKKDAENNQRKDDLRNEVISSKSFYPSMPVVAGTLIRITHPFPADQFNTTEFPRSCFHPPSLC